MRPVKPFTQNRILYIAIAISVLVHGALLAVRFTLPAPARIKPTDPALEVILVNAKSQSAPLKAEALAQVNLDGGGNADAGRAKSPLPDMQKTEDGDSLNTAEHRIAELEQKQQQMLSQMQSAALFSVQEPSPKDHWSDAVQSTDGNDLTPDAKALRREQAEIAKSIEDYNKRPKKTLITPSTRGVQYAMYYKTFADKVERLGTLNFPHKNGKKLYGKLVVSVPIFQDGTIYTKDGGLEVERSSSVPGLDAAALRIIQRAAPFKHFPHSMRSGGPDEVWEVIVTLDFSREGQLETELRSASID
ncbi:energy transducer TonB [Glaciimonas sp. PAMC28666]|uniref:energy transducer TonB n=1 Tax=Glaciimonas sp. PAMC28666 TaxID=2807626 RepID=UPI001964C6C0|nr:energy transducer TonB [Glaciimonas sp. PAMC28666]QRX80986.1 energy transducer TonB [Glaciimonas sp. PAMC28666]